MSWQAKHWAKTVIEADPPQLRGKARQVRVDVLRMLADRHNPTQEPFTKIARLATDTGHSERQVQRSLAFWQRQGAIIPVHRGGHRSSIYWLQLDWQPVPLGGSTGTPSAPQPVPLAPDNRYPPSEPRDIIQEGEPSESRPAAPAAPAASPSPVQSSSPKEAPRIVTAVPSRRTPLPDGWQPDPEVRQAALDQGIDPDDIREELADWWLRNRIPQGDWNATFRCFVRVARRGRPSRRRDRIAENDAWVRESVAIVRAAQRGEAAL